MNPWHPTANNKTLKQRARIIAHIRQFFAARNVLEVDTPLLAHATVTDPHILSVAAEVQCPGDNTLTTFYLQTSPEYAMKRLIAAGVGDIYQICKAFRQAEAGRWHNIEFTMLEWYRMGFDHQQLMTEVDELLQAVLQSAPAERLSFKDIFYKKFQLDPHNVTLAELKTCAQHVEIPIDKNLFATEHDVNFWFNLLFSHSIEPALGQSRPTFIYDFPASLAALAKIRAGNPPLASRFEVYVQGMELANGFHELQDAKEQRARFEQDLITRRAHGTELVNIDEYFLAALHTGLPDCAGVALGVDRLVMLALQKESLKDVLSFPIESA